VQGVVQGMTDKVKQSLIRVLISQPGYEHLQPLAHGPQAAAAAGLRQQQDLQQQRQIGGAPYPCMCVEPRHKSHLICWVNNPTAAPADWQGLGPKNPNFAVYIAACNIAAYWQPEHQ
jgi:hypothetical protein